MTNRLVSVLMPLKNAEKYVEQALRSVLAQGCELEVLVVDDASTDASAKIVRSLADPRVRLIAGEGRGAAVATNLALDRARGSFIAFCDADDLYPGDRLEWQIDYLETHPEYAGVCGSFSSIDSTGRPVVDYPTGERAEEITAELRRAITRAPLVGFLLRAEVVRALDGFRPYFSSAYDIDFQLRLGEKHRVFYFPKKVYVWRLHGTSVTHTQATQLREFYERTARAFLTQRIERGGDDLDRGCPPPPPVSSDPAHGAGEHIAGLLIGQAWRKHEEGEHGAAISCGLKALRVAPARIEVWRSLAALLVKTVLRPTKK